MIVKSPHSKKLHFQLAGACLKPFFRPCNFAHAFLNLVEYFQLASIVSALEKFTRYTFGDIALLAT